MVCTHPLTSHCQTITATDRVRNATEYPVLGTLLGGPLHGYEMRRWLGELDRSGGSPRVKFTLS